jgi:hypothetical protein
VRAADCLMMRRERLEFRGLRKERKGINLSHGSAMMAQQPQMRSLVSRAVGPHWISLASSVDASHST